MLLHILISLMLELELRDEKFVQGLEVKYKAGGADSKAASESLTVLSSWGAPTASVISITDPRPLVLREKLTTNPPSPGSYHLINEFLVLHSFLTVPSFWNHLNYQRSHIFSFQVAISLIK